MLTQPLEDNFEKMSLVEEECEEIHVEKLSAEELVEYARYGEQAILEELVSQKLTSRLVSLDDRGNSMLHMFAANGHIDCLQYILNHLLEEDKQRIMDTQNAEGNTAMHWASMAGQLAAVQLLMAHKATVGIENKAERTPIEEAHKHQRKAILNHFEQALATNLQTENDTESQ